MVSSYHITCLYYKVLFKPNISRNLHQLIQLHRQNYQKFEKMYKWWLILHYVDWRPASFIASSSSLWSKRVFFIPVQILLFASPNDKASEQIFIYVGELNWLFMIYKICGECKFNSVYCWKIHQLYPYGQCYALRFTIFTFRCAYC